MTVRFEVESDQPVQRLEVDLVDDGEPAQEVAFGVGLAFDGRYWRALAFKPTVNGTWPLRLRAWNVRGEFGETVCRPGVTVTF